MHDAPRTPAQRLQIGRKAARVGMTENMAMGLVGSIGALVLVGSSLLARRLPLAKTVKMAVAWVAIFAVLYAVTVLIG